METIEIKCNGIYLPAFDNPIIPESEYPNYDEAINSHREVFQAEHQKEFSGRYNTGKYTSGVRFNSNHDVMVRIISVCPSKQVFLDHLGEWINAALDDCAQSDYWYAFEKDWGREADESY